MSTPLEDQISRELHKAGLADIAAQTGFHTTSQTDLALKNILSVHPRIEELKMSIRKFAPSDLPILILGETGVGKELFARALHGERKQNTFVALNCGAIPSELLESELFGSVKGAFTGANTDRKGLIEKANNGTLFLDEIGDMPPLLQCKMLRVLQDQTYRKVGDTSEQKADFRLISATNHIDLLQSNNFRKDLYYRLAGHVIKIPPLRERGLLDIALIAAAFAKTPHVAERIINDTENGLKDFPGNVRELINLIKEYNVIYT